MKLIIDLHAHTIASGHAYSTILENVNIAKDKGIQIMGVSDHAPKLPGSSYIYYFNNLKVVPKEIYGVRVLKGVEANILDECGTIDMNEENAKTLDYVIASMHPPCVTAGTVAQNTIATINTIKNPIVNIIGHPDDNRFKLDYEEVVKAAKDNNVLLEVNNSSLNPAGFRQNSRDNIAKILEFSMKHNHPVIVGSDAHICFDVGEFSFAQNLIEELGFPEELVVNTSVEKLGKYIKPGLFRGCC